MSRRRERRRPLEAFAPELADRGTRWACFLAWGGCVLWAVLRTPAQAARELLWLAAAVTALVPLGHGLMTGHWPWITATSGQWTLFWVDGVALAMALGSTALARATARRAHTADPHGVWADPARPG